MLFFPFFLFLILFHRPLRRLMRAKRLVVNRSRGRRVLLEVFNKNAMQHARFVAYERKNVVRSFCCSNAAHEEVN